MNDYTEKFNEIVCNSIEQGDFVECVASCPSLEIALMKRYHDNEYTYFIMCYLISRGFVPVRCFVKLDLALSAFNALTVSEITK